MQVNLHDGRMLQRLGFPRVGEHRRFVTAIGIDAVGSGVWMPVSMIFFLSTTELSLVQVGLALSLAMALRDRGIPGPAALGLICPWADLAIDVDGGRPKTRDPLINPSMAAQWAPRYVGEHDPRLPGISPARGDMAGLPPIVLHSAGDDPLCIDADKIEKAAAEAGTGRVEHRRFDDLWHDFHLQAGVLAEADEAINHMGARLRTLMTEKEAAI